jgi:hypothetical protein
VIHTSLLYALKFILNIITDILFQTATVIPSIRAVPSAQLQPTVNSTTNEAVLTPSPQEFSLTSITPPISVRTREDSSESALEESAPNVLLVRPNEMHPQPSSSSASVPSSSGTQGERQPLLKRPRQPETEQQEPQVFLLDWVAVKIKS